jgi:hypothetical protein
MSTKAQIFQALLAGLRFDGVTASSYVVYFVPAGSAPSINTLQGIWLDANKTTPADNPYSLDANGQAELYLDGNYDVIIKTEVGGVVKATWNVQLTSDGLSTFNVDSRDASAGDVNVSVVAANDPDAVVVTIGKTKSDNSANFVIITPASGTIGGQATWSIGVGGEYAMLIPIPEENDYLVK